MWRPRSLLCAILWLASVVTTAGDLAAQTLPPGMVRFAYALEHQSATAAVDEIRPLLSQRGRVEILPDGRTVEIRDRVSTVETIVRRLREFDRPGPRFHLEVMVVQAFTAVVSPPPPSSPEIPRELIQQWQEVLRYTHYRLVARSELTPFEGERVEREIGEGYSVGFKLGPVMARQRVKLQDFRLVRRTPEGDRALIHTTLNPWLDRSLALGLARDEKSRTALMVVILCRQPESWRMATGEQQQEQR